jgi:hypothetical protein
MIKELKQIKDCPVCRIDNYDWTNEYRPEAYVQIALLVNEGLVVSMTAIEQNPLRRYTKENDPVYKDSGLEVFINLAPSNEKSEYMNFEMNAYGTLLSQFGTNKNRSFLSELTTYRAICKAEIGEKDWNVLLLIPMELICWFNDGKQLKQGDKFTFNCYKISEDPSIEHYASYSPIQNPIPNFHLPQFFGEAIIDDMLC